eukprot:PhM_4_TR438/c1_g1_i2/m.20068
MAEALRRVLITPIDIAAHVAYAVIGVACATVAVPALAATRCAFRLRRRLARHTSPRGKLYVVTGAASGFGRELSLRLVRMGATVLACDVNEAGLRAVAHECEAASSGGTFLYKVVDLSSASACASFGRYVREQCDERNACLSGLVNNAGIGSLPLSGVEFDDTMIDRLIGVNLLGVIRLTRECFPVLRKCSDARIVNVLSIASYMAARGGCLYATSKMALEGYSDALRAEMPSNIRVSTVHPFFAKTGIFDSLRDPEGLAKKSILYNPANEKMKEALLRGEVPMIMSCEVVVDEMMDALVSTYPKDRYIVCPAPAMFLAQFLSHAPNYFEMKTKILRLLG